MGGKTFINPFDGKTIRHPIPSASDVITWVIDDFISLPLQAVYTLSVSPKTNSIHFYREGLALREGATRDYTRVGTVITLNLDVALTIKSGENLWAQYCEA